jgi:3',5'-cyclic-AMP phosphodiesterase
MVMGEHDYYLDLGEYWEKLFGPHYSFDHKGVHFVVLNSILTYDEWTFDRWPTASSACSRWPASTTPTARRSWSAKSSASG